MDTDHRPLNFIEHIVEEDLKSGYEQSDLKFRFPPEPNGYLHIGHASSICLNFGLGLRYNAPVNLRFDDTNPTREEKRYVDAIKRDIEWLGFQWAEECYASDYFPILYLWAVELIRKGKAYVDQQSSEEIARQKGTPTEPGVPSPYRDRPVEESLRLLEGMKEGQFPAGNYVLRAKIDMASPNMLLRDPIMYRVMHQEHYRTGSDWKIYPMYDWAHGQGDYIEQISHSLCTLEFKPHRELYDWFLDQLDLKEKIRPKQREFARRNISHTVVSKRKLLRLVQDGVVQGWDDPRMPTISGLRRRGYTPESIRAFARTVGIAKRDNLVDVALLEHHVREDLNKKAPRLMAVLNPIKLIIVNYPEGEEEWLTAENNPEDEAAGSRQVPFSRELYIEAEDFREEANRKFFRLKLGGEVRLKNAYIIKAERVVKDAQGQIQEVHCTYDPKSRSGSDTEESRRKVKGTLHWVSAGHARPIRVRKYDRLFTEPMPDRDKERDFMEYLNPDSLVELDAWIEPSIGEKEMGQQFQFQRLGYYVLDPDSTEGRLIFNQTVPLKDSWAKLEVAGEPMEKPRD